MRYVLDSFAVLAYLGGEKGSDKVEELLNEAEEGKTKVYMNYVNLGEVYYTIYREEGVDKANEAIVLVKRLPIEFVAVNERIALIAARIKATHNLSYADAYVVATAIEKEAEIVTGDTEFEGVDVQILWIR